MTVDDGGGVKFPDVPKLALDELLDQLVEQAQSVRRTQGRLRALLRSIASVSGDLSLEHVLRRIAEAAQSLADAQYAALGVISPDRRLEQFIHVGMPVEDAAAIGHLPEGKGLLGALINDPRPIRLRHITDDGRSAGFPANHPAMDSFLGVPIRVRNEVFGNLYLSNSAHGEFSNEDEELMIALASAAGTAISNARLYQEAQLRQRWLEASSQIHEQLLRATGEDPLRSIAQYAIDIAAADLVTIALLDDERESLAIECAFGERADELITRRFSVHGTMMGSVVTTGTPVLAVDIGELDLPAISLQGIIEAGPILAVPLLGTTEHRGVLTLVRRRGLPTFTRSELAMAAAFAQQASVALELADARAAEQQMIVLEDRERIARDLHDHVIQELFAVGLSLEGVAGQLNEEPLSDRLRQRVEDLDRVIRRIRTSIFALRGGIIGSPHGLREAVMEVARSLSSALDWTPSVTFAGLLDLELDPELVDDAVACVRELLTNVAKHAHARSASVDLELRDDQLTITVADDGVGMPAGGRRSGIANLRDRAERHRGTLELCAAPSGGTIATWKVRTR